MIHFNTWNYNCDVINGLPFIMQMMMMMTMMASPMMRTATTMATASQTQKMMIIPTTMTTTMNSKLLNSPTTTTTTATTTPCLNQSFNGRNVLWTVNRLFCWSPSKKSSSLLFLHFVPYLILFLFHFVFFKRGFFIYKMLFNIRIFDSMRSEVE